MANATVTNKRYQKAMRDAEQRCGVHIAQALYGPPLEAHQAQAYREEFEDAQRDTCTIRRWWHQIVTLALALAGLFA